MTIRLRRQISHLSHSFLINAGDDLRNILLIAMTFPRGETSATGPSPRRSFGQRTSLGHMWNGNVSHERTVIERSWLVTCSHTLQATNISHLGKRKIAFEHTDWEGDMFAPHAVGIKCPKIILVKMINSITRSKFNIDTQNGPKWCVCFSNVSPSKWVTEAFSPPTRGVTGTPV